MKEKVYCPHCDTDNVTTNVLAGGREHSSFVSFIMWLLGGLIASFAYDLLYPGEYCQVTHHCRNCGYTFYEVESNRVELDTAKTARRKTITTSVLLVLIGVLLCVASVWFAGIVFVLGGLLLLIRVFSLSKDIRQLKTMLKEMEDCLKRHESPYHEKATIFDQNRIPAWQRVEMESAGK